MTNRFAIQYHDDEKILDDRLRTRLEKRLAELARTQRDLFGGMVSIWRDSGLSRRSDYRLKIVLYGRRTRLTAVERGETPGGIVTGALDTIERRVRQHRAKRRDVRKRAVARRRVAMPV